MLTRLKYRCIFGYQYLVDGSRFSGLFALDTITERRANQVRQQLMGLNVTAGYDAAHPQMSSLQEAELAGCDVLSTRPDLAERLTLT